MGATQPSVQQPTGFRPPFAAQPMGQPFMVSINNNDNDNNK